MKYDLAVIGGGIVGLATALELVRRRQGRRILLLEKEAAVAFHQSGHNSGVIHSGIYYQPGSLKARLTQDGNLAMVDFCQKHGIEHEVCGKVIVATEERELSLLDNLYERGCANGLKLAKIDHRSLKEIEPYAAGLAAIKVPGAGIVDYRQVAEKMASLIKEGGGEIKFGAEVVKFAEEGSQLIIDSTAGQFRASLVVNCGGLFSDRLARLAHVDPIVRIVPFRGEYYHLKPDKRYLVNNLIYPVPNPKFPFLGVHFTRMIDGSIHAGPNAVVALKREGYRKTDFNLRDFLDIVSYPGFWRLAAANFGEGMKEAMRSISKKAFVRSLQRIVPDVTGADLEPSPSGVRAQALMPDGTIVHDFSIIEGPRSIHVINAPSPAATASLKLVNTWLNFYLNAYEVALPLRRPYLD